MNVSSQPGRAPRAFAAFRLATIYLPFFLLLKWVVVKYSGGPFPVAGDARSGFLRFFNLYDKIRPENQTKRGECDSFRKILKVLVYVFCSKRLISGRSSETLWELPSIGATVVERLKVKFWRLAVCRNGRGGVAQRRALRRAARADDHRDWRALCKVHVPARG